MVPMSRKRAEIFTLFLEYCTSNDLLPLNFLKPGFSSSFIDHLSFFAQSLDGRLFVERP